MSALKRHIIERDGDRHWVVGGSNGAITWGLLTDNGKTFHGPIGIHSPRPQFEDDKPTDDCHVLEGTCYVDAGYLAGDHLGEAWKAAGRDDEVIWRELEDWYEERFLGIYTTDEAAS